jgi:phospholipid/cholesterol/gamma-HCH transport system substrate-binding protein
VSRNAEIKVGVTVLVAVAVLIGGLAFLKDWSLDSHKRLWHVAFPETGGLAESDEVHVNGLRRGQVKKMKLEGDHVLVDLKLASEINLTRDSRVVIRNVGMMGEKVIDIDLKATGAPYSPDETIPGIYEPGLDEVMGQFGSVVESVTQLADNLNRVTGSLADNDRLSRTIDNFGHTSEQLRLAVSENRAMLRETMQNFGSASRTVKSLTSDRERQLGETMDHVGSAAEKMDALAVRLDSLRTVIHSVATKVDRGDGTIGRLVQDDSLYVELNESVKSLRALIDDIKAHPKKYFKFSVF